MATSSKKQTASRSGSSSRSHGKGGSRTESKSASRSTKSASRAGKSASRAKSHPGTSARESTRKGASASASRGRGATRSRRNGKVEGAGQATVDHEQIRRWVEERGGSPACVRGTGRKGDIGMLRIDMPGYTGQDKLEHIDWDEWFEKFDEKNLAFLYQDETKDGTRSNFNKLVSRENAK